jgi:hypothetical protein
MSSSDELASWLERHSETVRRISRDPLDAERKLALAERNLERAQRLLAAAILTSLSSPRSRRW